MTKKEKTGKNQPIQTLKRNNKQLENNASNLLEKSSRKNGNHFLRNSNSFSPEHQKQTNLAKGIISKTLQWANLLFPNRKQLQNKTMHTSIKTWIWPHLKHFRNRSLNLTPKLKTKEIHQSSTRNHTSKQNKWLSTTDQKMRIPINTAIINSKSSSSGKRDHQMSNDQLLNLKVKWIHILLILRR